MKKATFYIKGMHCPSCEILIKDKFKEEKNIIMVKADFKSCQVEVGYKGEINQKALNKKISKFGYQIIDYKNEIIEKETFGKRVVDFGVIGAILLLLYGILKEAGLLPDFNFDGNLNLFSIFVLGLVASTSTCMATSGALFLSLVKPFNLRQAQGEKENIMMSFLNNENLGKAIFFNAGRIIFYGFFGFLAGFLGQALIVNLKLGQFLTFLAAIFMLFLGLDLTKIVNIGTIIPSKLNNIIFENLKEKLIKYPRKAPFFLGAITYFLPCGFTQAVQVYALGLASPVFSALTMMVFALGTSPALFFIGGLAIFKKSQLYQYFMKTMGVLIFFVGFSYLLNFFSFYGVNFSFFSYKNLKTGAVSQNGYQIIKMTVNSSGYSPNVFTIKKGIPVKWIINGENVYGCQGYLVVPSLGIQKTLKPGENIIEFIPKKQETIYFSCSMAMYRGRIEVED